MDSFYLASPLQTFHRFALLPIEIRLRVWQFAAPRRPRIIQIGFDPEESCWKAWKDITGSLPSIVPVCREARDEALKSYSRAFDAYVDLKEDTVFISDPLFTIRNPRSIFMASKDAQLLRKVAFTSDIYDGLTQSHLQYPRNCEAPMSILRRLKGLIHFTLVLSEDGAGAGYLSDEDSDHDYEDGDEDEEEEEQGFATDLYNEDMPLADASHPTLEAGSEFTNSGDNEDVGRIFLEQQDEDRIILDRLDEEAVEHMSKGYFRHPGNIHFESAATHRDHWENWAMHRDELETSYEQEKLEFPAWVRPKVSIMAVKYGLSPLHDVSTKLHLLGDHCDDALEDGTLGCYEYGSDSEPSSNP